MRRISTSIPLVLLISAAFPALAYGADVSVRAGVQDGFVRLVFSGTGLPQADVQAQGKDVLRLTFNKAVRFSGGGKMAGISPEISVTPAPNPAQVLVTTGGLTRHRTLSLGDRLFVDLFFAEKPTQAAKADIKPEPEAVPVAPPALNAPEIVPEMAAALAAKTQQKEPEKKAEPAQHDKKPEPDVQAKGPPAVPVEAVDASALGAAPAAAVDAVAKTVAAPEQTKAPEEPAFVGSAIITIGSTQGVALAAFERSGYLWIVLSQSALSVPPVVSGPDAAKLGNIDSVKIDGGSAYRVKLPRGAFVRPEGAGLVWRLYVEGKQTPLKSVTADRDFSDMSEGPKVHIPINTAASVLRLPDPEIGDDLAVVTVGRAEARLINADRYVDFDILPAIVGAVVRPKADGMRIAVLPTEVVVSRQGGLRMSAGGPRGPVSSTAVAEAAQRSVETKEPPATRVFNLQEWAMGGPRLYTDMRRSIDERVATAEEARKLPELISGAKFMLAQGLAPEGNGFLQMALAYMPMLRDAPDFQALRGAILALSGQPEEALNAFAIQGLEGNDEIAFWRGYALALLGRQTEAQKAFPPTMKGLITSYPERLQALMLPPIIETVLARGDVNLADTLTNLYDKAAAPSVYPDHDSGVAYFRGRIAMLRGDMDGAMDHFREASDGYQGKYPVLGTLSLVERGLSARTIARDEAVRKLERFRYGWRGDELESSMLERLGLIYVTGGEQRRGLTILRDAATMASTPELKDKLVAVMQKAFRELFSGKTKEKMTPLESASVAAEFAELMPAGGEGEQITLTIADQMVAVDLLDRAADLIEPMVDVTENRADALRYAQRAAAIRLTDDRPKDALKIIDKALSRVDVQATPLDEKELKSFALLRASAKAKRKKTDDAFVELDAIAEDADSLKLRADIAWGAQRWAMAADSLGKLIKLSNLDATRPPTQEQAQMILNHALALNLAGRSGELDSLRIGYSDIMRRSDLFQPFQLVTRTAREAKLADRATLLKLVSEVNMFKSVLESYQTQDTAPVPEKTAKAEPAAPETTKTDTKNSQADQKDQKEQEKPAEPVELIDKPEKSGG